MRTQSATTAKLLTVMGTRHYWTMPEIIESFGYSAATTRKLVSEAITSSKVVTEKLSGTRTLRYWLADTYKRKIAARRAYYNRSTSGIVDFYSPMGMDNYLLYAEKYDLELELDRVTLPVIPQKARKTNTDKKTGLALGFNYNDGGRALAGLKGSASDCVVRAIAIATKLPYLTVRNMLIEANKIAGRKSDPDKGNLFTIYAPILYSLGWAWSPLRGKANTENLPKGTVIAIVTNHAVAVIDHIANDTWHCSKRGTKNMRGYFYKRIPDDMPFPIKSTVTGYSSAVTFVTSINHTTESL